MTINYLRKNKFIKFGINTLIILLIIATLPYYLTRIYDFSEPKPFTGDRFYNPYSNIKGEWIKANFHAHSKAFGGITKGKNTKNEVVERYQSLGYKLICISNYSQADTGPEGQQFFKAYEHGININWTHQLVINPEKSSFFDFPFFQSKSHKQFIINKLKKDHTIVALAHPSFKSSYSQPDLKYLNNYDFIEGLSQVATSVADWDKALSNGHAVWIMGNDDSHNIGDGNNGICWTMINTDSLCEDQLLKSLKRGACYATRGWLGQEMNRIVSVKVTNNTYELLLEKESDSIILKSDEGKTVATETNSNKILYTIKPCDTYIRAEIYDTEPWNNYTKIYLNPVVRTQSNNLVRHNNTAEINVFKTIIFVLLVFVSHAIMIYALYLADFKTPSEKSVRDN